MRCTVTAALGTHGKDGKASLPGVRHLEGWEAGVRNRVSSGVPDLCVTGQAP